VYYDVNNGSVILGSGPSQGLAPLKVMPSKRPANNTITTVNTMHIIITLSDVKYANNGNTNATQGVILRDNDHHNITTEAFRFDSVIVLLCA